MSPIAKLRAELTALLHNYESVNGREVRKALDYLWLANTIVGQELVRELAAAKEAAKAKESGRV